MWNGKSYGMGEYDDYMLSSFEESRVIFYVVHKEIYKYAQPSIM